MKGFNKKTPKECVLSCITNTYPIQFFGKEIINNGKGVNEFQIFNLNLIL